MPAKEQTRRTFGQKGHLEGNFGSGPVVEASVLQCFVVQMNALEGWKGTSPSLAHCRQGTGLALPGLAGAKSRRPARCLCPQAAVQSKEAAPARGLRCPKLPPCCAALRGPWCAASWAARAAQLPWSTRSVPEKLRPFALELFLPVVLPSSSLDYFSESCH